MFSVRFDNEVDKHFYFKRRMIKKDNRIVISKNGIDTRYEYYHYSVVLK